MSRITPELSVRHTRARVLRQIAGEILSDFECELIAEVSDRRRLCGADAEVTPSEAAVLAEAVAGMETHLRRCWAAGKLRAERDTAVAASRDGASRAVVVELRP